MGFLTRIKAISAQVGNGAVSIWKALILPVSMVRINRKIARDQINTSDIEALTDADLRSLIDAEWGRAKELDDKLQKLTAALSVSVTVGGLVGSTVLQDIAVSGWKIAAAALFLIAAVLLVTGVVLGFNGLRPKPRYGYGAGFLRIMADGGAPARAELVAAARNFQRDNMIRSNEAIAATASIRNGVLVFVLAVLIGMVAAAAGKGDKDDCQSVARTTVTVSHETVI